MIKLPQPGDLCTPAQAQELALSEALRGAGFVSPNPLVGCTVVSKDGVLLACGYHARVGEAHAEVHALDKIPTDKRAGTTVYVTLEPCSHHGRTPPCADRLVQERVAKVVIGVLDPNALVSGRGIEKLKAAGIVVTIDPEFGKKAERLAEQFLWNMRHKMPFVTLKLAMSLDGKIALNTGESQWITSDASRDLGRSLRAQHDATLIGAQTLLHDNPTLDFRGTVFENKKSNKIIIWDPKSKTQDFLKTSTIAKKHALKNIQTITTLDTATLKDLYSQGITSVFIEGGAKTLSHCIENKIFNKLYVFIAPVLLGNGLDWTSSINLGSMSERMELEFTDMLTVGRDILLTAYPKNKN